MSFLAGLGLVLAALLLAALIYAGIVIYLLGTAFVTTDDMED